MEGSRATPCPDSDLPMAKLHVNELGLNHYDYFESSDGFLMMLCVGAERIFTQRLA